MKQLLPVARSKDLLIKELPDETLIYDLDADQAHCLNRVCAFVWQQCNGKRSVKDLTRLLRSNLRASVPEAVVWIALEQLEQFNLLAVSIPRPRRAAIMSRRHLMRSLGLAAAVSIPMITSIVAPTAANAASCGSLVGRDDNCPCTSSAQCLNGCCRSGQCKPGGGGCAP